MRDPEESPTPVNVRPPTPAEIERDRLRREKEAAWARARAEGDAVRARERERAAAELDAAKAAAGVALARERQAAADAKGTLLAPTGEARRAMVRSLVLCAIGTVLYVGVGPVVAVLDEVPVPSRVLMAVVGALVGLGFLLAAWYWWWLGVVGFVADKIGDAVAKRLEDGGPRRPGPGGPPPSSRAP